MCAHAGHLLRFDLRIVKMKGNGVRQASISSNYSAPPMQVQPSSKALLEGYRASLESSNEDHPRFNPVCQVEKLYHKSIYSQKSQLNQSHPRSSALLNPDDPVSMHLLMETAMGDSQQYEVLSFEEIDELKKQLVLLSNRIDTTKRKLVLESKLRDAALSLNRLHSTNGRDSIIGEPGTFPKRHRRSIMGSRGSNTDLLSKTDDELATSTRKCEDLAQELWKLEKRAQDLQRRLLEHTAGVLQMTHKGYLKKETPPPSPDGVHDYLQGRELPYILDGSHDFDDRSFYQALDTMLDLGDGEKKLHSEPTAKGFAQHTQTILETERRLEDLNQRLRDSISLANKSYQHLPPSTERHDERPEDPIRALQEQLGYLEKGFDMMQEDQDATSQDTKRSASATEERLEDLNMQLQGIITRANEDPDVQYPRPPETNGKTSEAQIHYLERGLDTVEKCVERLTVASHALSSKSIAHEEKSGQFETVLLGLWEILVSEEEDFRQQDHQSDKALNEPFGTSSTRDEFSLQAFSTKVQSLFARAKGLQEEKVILSKQVQQQREINSKFDADKDTQFSNLNLQLEQSKKSFEGRDKEAKQSKDELILVMQRLDAAKQEAALCEQQREVEESSALWAERAERMNTEERLSAELQANQDDFVKLQAELQNFRDDSGIANAKLLTKLEQSERRIQDLSAELSSLQENLRSYQTSEANLKHTVEQKTQELEDALVDMLNLEAELVRLRTEVTVARAELDGAYGTRAQRAAEGATNPAIQRELNNLVEKNSSLLDELTALRARQEKTVAGNAEMTQQVQILQRELSETLSEYEVMTKSSIEFEKEREQLENAVDGLRDRCESLQTELSDERVRWLGVGSPGATSGRESHPPGTTSTMVLKNEFKKMMRETRAENQKALRVSWDVMKNSWLC